MYSKSQNLLELDDVVKGMSDDRLFQEGKQPSGIAPQFLIVSEIDRRTREKKKYEEQQKKMPEKTVSQQTLDNALAAQQNAMPPASTPNSLPMGQGLPQANLPPPPQGPNANVPPQAMYAGGVVKMQDGGRVPSYAELWPNFSKYSDGYPTDYNTLVLQAAEKYGLDPALLLGQMRAESSGNPMAMSPDGSGGLMQLMEGTAGDLGLTPEQRFDPALSIDAGARYMKQMKDAFGTDKLAAQAYHSGPGRLGRVLAGESELGPQGKNYWNNVVAAAPLEGDIEPLGQRREVEDAFDPEMLVAMLDVPVEHNKDPQITGRSNAQVQGTGSPNNKGGIFSIQKQPDIDVPEMDYEKWPIPEEGDMGDVVLDRGVAIKNALNRGYRTLGDIETGIDPQGYDDFMQEEGVPPGVEIPGVSSGYMASATEKADKGQPPQGIHALAAWDEMQVEPGRGVMPKESEYTAENARREWELAPGNVTIKDPQMQSSNKSGVLDFLKKKFINDPEMDGRKVEVENWGESFNQPDVFTWEDAEKARGGSGNALRTKAEMDEAARKRIYAENAASIHGNPATGTIPGMPVQQDSMLEEVLNRQPFSMPGSGGDALQQIDLEAIRRQRRDYDPRRAEAERFGLELPDVLATKPSSGGITSLKGGGDWTALDKSFQALLDREKAEVPKVDDIMERRQKMAYAQALMNLGAGVMEGKSYKGLRDAGEAMSKGASEAQQMDMNRRMLEYADKNDQVDRDLAILSKMGDLNASTARMAMDWKIQNSRDSNEVRRFAQTMLIQYASGLDPYLTASQRQQALMEFIRQSMPADIAQPFIQAWGTQPVGQQSSGKKFDVGKYQK